MAVSHSRSRTKTIFCSLSGIASMAMLRPERPGPIRAHCSSSVPAPSGRRVNRQVAIGWPGSPTVQVKRRGGSHSVIVLTVSHCPAVLVGVAAGEPAADRRAGRARPARPPPAVRSSARGIRKMSLTMPHTRSGGASMRISAATAGQSAYTCPVHSMKSRLEPHCGSRLNRGTTSRMITVPGPAQPAAAGDPAAAASAIHVTGLRKRYGDVTALADVDLVVRAGEFFTLLGPSGSGKTTLLRLIAGFERPDAGRIELGGRDVTRVPPYARDVNTVFQDYALFPHMTVAQNIEYGLRVRRVAKAERREKVDRALEMVRLPGLGGRKPAQLSGGQRQRVALARAIVNEPERAAAGRAARRAGPQAPPGDAARAAAGAARGGHHVRLRHARPGRGADDERPHRGAQRRPDRADRRARRGVRAAADPVRGRVHRRLQPDRAGRPHDHRAAGEDHPGDRRRAGPARHARRARADQGRHLRRRAHPLRRGPGRRRRARGQPAEHRGTVRPATG